MVKHKNKKTARKELSLQQQELIDVINTELVEFSRSQIDLISDLSERKFKREKLEQILETQVDVVNRVGSAAEIIGLHGLKLFCEHMQKNFKLMKSQGITQSRLIDSQLLYWYEVIQSYLIDPSDSGYIQEMLEHLSSKDFPIIIDQQEKNKIEEAFCNSYIQIDSGERIKTATPELVSLEISDDIDADTIENMMLNLPKQAEKLSIAVKSLQEADFANQLRIAEKVAHTLKGVSNTVGIRGIANITHCMEDIFEVLLKANKKPSRLLYESLQNAAECLEEMCEYLEGVGEEPKHSVKVFQEILTWANNVSNCDVIDQTEIEVDSLNHINDRLDEVGTTTSIETVNDSSADLSLRVSAKLVDDLLNSTGETIITSEQIAELVLSLKSSIQNIVTSNKNIKLRAYEIENLIESQELPSELARYGKDQRSDLLELDQFDELHVSASQLVEATEDASEFSNQVQNILYLLEKHSLNQIRMLQENQNAVLRIRMIPVESIVPRLKRAVKQVCESSNKLAELKISGEDTLVDSEFLHQLEDPIMHILRNAVVHGIEMPDVRVAQGKNEHGEIHLSFDREGNTIHVTCHDDGFGLDFDRIKIKAIENKLLSQNDEFNDNDAIQMILRHGFSTQDKASQFSGRGVGLAAVHEKVMEMKGTIAIDSTEGNGINVGISVPTNLNSLHVLLVNCDDLKIAISSRGIDEILYPSAGKIILISGKYYFEHMHQRYPLFDLRFMLERTPQNKPQNCKVILLVNEDVNNICAVAIDKIFDTRDIIAKPISELVPIDSGLLGTTILGDGTITTVIDIVELLKHARLLESKKITRLQTKEEKIDQPLALVVDDSISSRQSLAGFIQEFGFKVKTAKDGVEALYQIREKSPTIVLTDIEMPRMNGFELSAHLRSNEETASIPIVMLTSKFLHKHKQEAESLRISAYITKPYNEDELLEVINSLNLIDHVIA